jgi:hypothetical protein
MIRFFKRHKWCALLLVILIAAAAFWGYTADCCKADETALAALASTPEVEVVVSDKHIAFIPKILHAGLIFYPGGKVEHTAYVPLMQACAQQGILCVLTEMPFRLAVLDIRAADGIREQFPEVENWYLGGHSLGGAMASAYLEKHANQFEGLILLGAYASADLSQSGLEVLSLYGSEDGVLDREKYDSSKSNLPEKFTEVVIEGGCHAGFGFYGPQKGDGNPTLTTEEQIEFTVRTIIDFVA